MTLRTDKSQIKQTPMSARNSRISHDLPVIAAQSAHRELQLQKVLVAYIVSGLFFMVLPGTFLGVWNLVSISSRHALESLSPSWLQAHGHAQVFGWVGTFVLGIGFYSLSKMGRLPAFAISRAWIALMLWVVGVASRWIAGVLEWHWRIVLPISAMLELAGFLIFFVTVSGHHPVAGQQSPKREPWMLLVVSSTVGFLGALVLNGAASIRVAWFGSQPAFPHVLDQRLVALETWCFLVPVIWGFNARWLPVFLGLPAPNNLLLRTALAIVWAAVACLFSGASIPSAFLFPSAAFVAFLALQVWRRPLRPAKLDGVHSSFPFFVRAAYGWLLIGSALWLVAAWADHSGGIWGAARHALTVGYVSTMVFAIGQRVLPAFGGMRRLYSPRMMLGSLSALTIGCSLRVASEIPAYEGYSRAAWRLLPCSAIIELIAVVLFAANLLMTFRQPPAHLLAKT